MATHNINKITVPNGDVYNLLDSGRSDFVTKSGLLTSTGTSTNNTMTQDAITNAVTSATPYIITWTEADGETGPTVNSTEVLAAINANREVYIKFITSSYGGYVPLVGYTNGNDFIEFDFINWDGVNSGSATMSGYIWDSTSFWTHTGFEVMDYVGTDPIQINFRTISHANSGVTAQTTQALYPFTVNATGHITGVGSAITSMTPTSHTHGNITNAGDITTNAAIASGDRLVINDESASKLTNSSITFGTSTTQFLANNGTWQTPVGGVTDVQINGTSVLSSGVANIVTNSAYNSSTNKIATMNDIPSADVTDVQVNGTSILSSGTANLVTNTAYNASTNKIATMADVDVMTITYSLISGTDYEMNISTVLAPNYANTILGEEY